MVDRGEITIDVAAQNMRVPVPIALVGLDRPMRAFVDSIGERVIDEPGFEDRLHNRAKRVMHDAVPKRCG